MRIFAGWVLLMAFASLRAQQPAYFVLGESDFEGLQVYDVIQDPDFNYVFATDQGFYHYNGYTIRSLPMHGVKGRSGFGLVKNAKGAIYGHNLNNQILRITPAGCKVIHELQPEDQATDIYLTIDAQDRLLVVSKALLAFNADDSLIARHPLPPGYYSHPFLTKVGRTVFHILNSKKLAVWENAAVRFEPIQTDVDAFGGVLKFFRIRGRTFAVDVKDKQLYSFDEVAFRMERIGRPSFLEQSEFLRFYNENDQLWVAGTVSGVQLLTDPLRQASAPLMFRGVQVTDVFQDHEGNLLLSTANQGVIVVPDLAKPDAIPVADGLNVVSLRADHEMGLLLGMDNGQLMQMKNGEFVTLCAEGTRPLNSVFSWPDFPFILFDDGNIKVMPKRGGKAMSVFQGSLKDAARGDGNVLWLALNRGVVEMKWEGGAKFSFTNHDRLRARTNAVAWEPFSGKLYAATSDGLKLAGKEGSVEAAVYQGKPVIANDVLLHDGKVFVATREQGLLVYKEGSVLKQMRPGLEGEEPEILTLKIQGDQFYANTTRGLMVMDSNCRVITQLNKANGFSTNKIFDFVPIDSVLWICHMKGLQRLPKLQRQESPARPLVRLASVTVNDSAMNLGEGTEKFQSGQFKFLFELTSPTLRNRENIRYHHKLEGYDDKWLYSAYKDNQIVYNGLPPGSYRFLAFAENQGFVSPTVSYSFSIAAPFYLRWWFILLANVVVLGSVFLFFNRKLARQRRRAELLGELNMSKLKAIQSQMNPHFIFNALNSIQDLVLQGDIDNSYTYITKFAKLVRQTLRYSEMDFIDIEQELELLELYLSLEQLRFKEDLVYEIDADDMKDLEIPPMLIQPFVENALVHGLLHKEGLRKLEIRMEWNEQVVCIVEDNGIGREKAKIIKQRQRGNHESFALEAINRRFEILKERFGSQIGVEYVDKYEDGKPTGTKVIIRLPTRNKF